LAKKFESEFRKNAVAPKFEFKSISFCISILKPTRFEFKSVMYSVSSTVICNEVSWREVESAVLAGEKNEYSPNIRIFESLNGDYSTMTTMYTVGSDEFRHSYS